MDDHELRDRFRELGAAAPGHGGGIDQVRRRVRQRHTRRWLAGTAAVALLAGAAVGVTRLGDGPDEVRVAVEGGSTTTAATPTTTAAPAVGGLPDGLIVDENPVVVRYAPDGAVVWRATPFADRGPSRARAAGDHVVVLDQDGRRAALLSGATGRGPTVTLDRAVDTDLWTAGTIAGVPTIVTATYDDAAATSELVAVNLTTGSARRIGTASGMYLQPSLTADGRILAGVLDGAGDCRWSLVDGSTGTATATGLQGCALVEPTVSPDGRTAVDFGDVGLVRYDVATGARTGAWLEDVVGQAEGLQLDNAGRFVVISNAYPDSEHGPFVVVDTRTGTTATLPQPGPGSLLR